MSLMSYKQLVKLVEREIITPVKPEDINGSSIDVHLGSDIIVEVKSKCEFVDPLKRTNFPQRKIQLGVDGYMLQPGEFILAHTVETFNLPNNVSAEFRLKSSGARSGLNNLFACHCDPLWHDSTLTLELHNVLRWTAIKLTPGMPIGQMLFHHHEFPVPSEKGYAERGRYNKDKTVSSVKE